MDAFTGRDLRALEGLTDGSSDFADARDVRDHVGFLVDAVEIDQRSRQPRVRPLHLIEGVEAATKWPRRLCALEAVAPEVVGGLPFRRQPRAIEVAREVANGAAPPFELRLGTALGQIVDLVVVVFATEPRFLERAEREFFLGTACRSHSFRRAVSRSAESALAHSLLRPRVARHDCSRR